MQATMEILPVSNITRWVGRIISALAVLFLLFDGVIKLLNLQPVVDSFVLLGLPLHLAPIVGGLLLASLALYLIPRTAVLGAILLTGYLGGAISIQMRAEAELFSLVFPILIGALLWGGLFLRDSLLRALVPLHR